MSLRKTFNKLVIGGLMIASLAGIVSPAQAQQQTYNGGVTVTQTMNQQENLKPWANDPMYVEQMRLAQEQSDLRLSAFHQRMEINRANMNAWLAQQGQRQVNAAKARGGGGWNIANTVTQANAVMTRYNATMQTYNIQERQYELREEQNVRNYQARLDGQYARTSPYREILAEQAKARADAVRAQYSQGGVKVTQTNPGQR